MKKLLFLAPFLLAACGTTIAQKEVTLSTEQANLQVGPYPDNYKEILNSNGKTSDDILFKPVKYVTNEQKYGWLICTRDFKFDTSLLLINNGTIILNVNAEKERTAKNTCQHYTNQYNILVSQENQKNSQNAIQLEKEAKNKLTEIEKDTTKEYLFGSYPTDPMPIIKKYIDNILFDSESARYKDITINKTYRILDNKIVWCYAVIFQVNAKNRMGAYVGYKYAAFYLKDNKIIHQFIL